MMRAKPGGSFNNYAVQTAEVYALSVYWHRYIQNPQNIKGDPEEDTFSMEKPLKNQLSVMSKWYSLLPEVSPD